MVFEMIHVTNQTARFRMDRRGSVAPIPGILDVVCPSELTRLTMNATAVKARVLFASQSKPDGP